MSSMQDEELLNLYAQDQEEHKKFSLLKNDADKEKMRETIQKNDAKRREAVEELIPPLNSKITRSAEDYYMAAIIYSRSEAAGDRKKAQGYAKKAYALVQYRHDDFSDNVRTLYNSTNKKLMGNVPQATQAMTNTPTQLRLNNVARQNRRAVEQDIRNDRLEEQKDRRNDRMADEQDRKNDEMSAELDKPSNKPRCFTCGGNHGGPCPYK
ncbi:MAG: hypothetical protein ACO1N3_02775 [Gammaproteobacteria bacterium]